MVACIMHWARKYPDELVFLDKWVKSIRRESRDKFKRVTGMSQGEMMMHKGEIPSRLYFVIGKAIGNRDWFYDKRLRRIFWSHFKVGAVNRSSISTW